MKKSGSLFVVSGPSGVGKSTLVERVRRRMPELAFSISCTTRPPRGGEINGREYYFLSQEEFEERSRRGEFIEEARIFTNRYGTLREEVVRRMDSGVPVLLDIDVQGARQIRAAAAADARLAAAVVMVMIAPPSLDTVERRLRGRGTDSDGQIALRLAAVRGELANFRLYDYVVVNDDLDTAAAELESVFRAAALRTALIDGGLFND